MYNTIIIFIYIGYIYDVNKNTETISNTFHDYQTIKNDISKTKDILIKSVLIARSKLFKVQ